MAAQEFTKAIELDPDYAAAYYNRGFAYGKLGQYQRGIEDFDKAIQLDPDYAENYYSRGLAHDMLGQR